MLIGLLAAGLILIIALPERGEPIVLNPAPTSTMTPLPKPTQTPAPIQVLIEGQVLVPGKYLIDKNARLSDLISRAGGVTNEADTIRINTVLRVYDGDYIYIPAIGEDIPDTACNAPGKSNKNSQLNFDYPIDINSSSAEALESLPGIGPAKAIDIITYREEVQLFNSIEDLLNVPGIGQATFESLRELIKVD